MALGLLMLTECAILNEGHRYFAVVFTALQPLSSLFLSILADVTVLVMLSYMQIEAIGAQRETMTQC